MPTIDITAMDDEYGGPSIPSVLSAWTGEVNWPTGGKSKRLMLSIGDCVIRVWPADPERIKDLGNKLLKIAEELDVPRVP